MRQRYYHGGPEGRFIGDWILPPTITGARSLASLGAGPVCRTDRVYLTTSEEAALLFAASHRRPMVYVVAPHGLIEPDPDCVEAGLSWACPRAQVLQLRKPPASAIKTARSALMDNDPVVVIGDFPAMPRGSF